MAPKLPYAVGRCLCCRTDVSVGKSGASILLKWYLTRSLRRIEAPYRGVAEPLGSAREKAALHPATGQRIARGGPTAVGVALGEGNRGVLEFRRVARSRHETEVVRLTGRPGICGAGRCRQDSRVGLQAHFDRRAAVELGDVAACVSDDVELRALPMRRQIGDAVALDVLHAVDVAAHR